MSKYKIGDRVKCNDGCTVDTGTVTRFGAHCVYALWDSSNTELSFYENNKGVTHVEPEQNKDVQIIDGIEYPYVTVEGDYPARIVCDNIKHDHFTTVVATLIDGLETTDLLTSDFKAFVGASAPYIKAHTKPKSIFEGLKPGTVVFIRFAGETHIKASKWMPVVYQKFEGGILYSPDHCYDARFEFRLDNPYLED